MDSKIIFLILFVGFGVSVDVDITKGPPKADKPSIPGHGWFGESLHLVWKEQHENLLKLTREVKNKVKVIFLGDSLTEGWTGVGIDIWNKFYSNISAHNYGIVGDSTRQILWRIQNGELDGFNPKLLVLMIGTNNLYNNYNKGLGKKLIKNILKIV
jgi:beta-glucosidase